MWMTPKLNWSSTDFYNFEDLNRVESNTEVVADFIGYFIGLPPLIFKKDRDMKHIDFADSLDRIEGNQVVLSQRYKPLGWLQNKVVWKANDGFSYIDARRLETNINLLYLHYKGNAEAIPFCGAFTCGEEVI